MKLTISGWRQDFAPDLLVIGRHRRQPMRDSFIGTTAERVIRSVPCPVLMVKAPPVGPYRAILLAADLSEGCRIAIENFAALGIADHARVSALYVFDAPASGLAMSRMMPTDTMDRHLRKEHKDAERALAHFTEDLNVKVAERLVQRDGANPASCILEVAEQTGAGLVVVGTRGRSGLAKMLLGSVAEEILRNAEADVLAVPPKR
jgi:nucleotide-binding universal stress UspA family protein